MKGVDHKIRSILHYEYLKFFEYITCFAVPRVIVSRCSNNSIDETKIVKEKSIMDSEDDPVMRTEDKI